MYHLSKLPLSHIVCKCFYCKHFRIAYIPFGDDKMLDDKLDKFLIKLKMFKFQKTEAFIKRNIMLVPLILNATYIVEQY